MDITDGIKKIFLAGVGAVATTGEAAKNLIDNLVEKGELTVEQGKTLNEEMKKNAREKVNKHVTVNVVNEFKDVYSAMEKMTRDELADLKERLNTLTEEQAEDCGCGEESCTCAEASPDCKCEGETPSECTCEKDASEGCECGKDA